MPELANCERCDAVFAKTHRELCPACYKMEEQDFKIVYSFLTKKENREATLQEIVEATNVAEEVIIRFIKQKRLRTSQFPKLAYPCERCQTSIVSGKLCAKCSTELMEDLKHYEEIEKVSKPVKSRENVYFSYNKHSN